MSEKPGIDRKSVSGFFYQTKKPENYGITH
jgi:hypothetical protein